MSALRPFTVHDGVAAPLMLPNIDTDTIIPSREIKTVGRSGLGKSLFAGWRYLHDGQRRLGRNLEFVLNQPQYAGATVLLCGPNFGCGSSREHAVWALADHGVRVLVAPSFGAIFRGNCLRNAVLPVELPLSTVEALADWVAQDPQARRVTVDLQACELRGAPGQAYAFTIEPDARERLLLGRDEIDEMLVHAADLAAWRERDRSARPWVYAGERP